MKSKLIGLLGAIGAVMLTMWSAGVSAQTTTCSGNTCKYGPICPDGWGGCYWYTWTIGSAVNAYEEKSGIANIVKLCQPGSLQNCVFVTSQVNQVQTEHFNTLIRCQVPGADTCTDLLCGSSPNSSSFIFANQQFSQTISELLDSSGCTREDRSKGGIKCSKTNTLPGPAGLAAAFCPNANWLATWIPIDFEGITTATGPTSKQDPTLISTFARTHCWLLDSLGNKPSDAGYDLTRDASANTLFCEHQEDGIL